MTLFGQFGEILIWAVYYIVIRFNVKNLDYVNCTVVIQGNVPVLR